MAGPSDFYGWHRHQRMDPRAVGFRTEQEARDWANRSRDWDGQPRDRFVHFDYPDRERSPLRNYREWAPSFDAQPPLFNIPPVIPPPAFDVPPRDRFFSRRPRESRQEEDEEEGEYLEVEDEEEEEFDEGGQKLVDRPWLPKERTPQAPAAGSKSKGKALKPTRAAAAAGSSKAASESGEVTVFIPTAISDEIRVWLTTGLSTDDSKAISKKFELEFEDPTFSIKPPKLDGFMLRHAKDKDRLKGVNASEEALIQTQLKIMDVAPPLFDLYAKVCALEEGETVTQAKNTVRAVLQQWGRAYYHITQRRRRANVTLVEPTYDFILSNPDAFAPRKEATELLFTDKFLETMLKEASQDATPASSSAARARAKAGGRKVAVNPGPSQRVLRPRREAAAQFPVEGRQSGGVGRGRPPGANAWTRGGERYVLVPPSDPIQILRNTVVCENVGGRVLHFAKMWETVTDDRWVLDSVSNGVKLDFVETPNQTKLPRPITMSKEMASVCDQEVNDLLEKKAIVEISNSGEHGSRRNAFRSTIGKLPEGSFYDLRMVIEIV
ncbi:hypothetical protein DAPPUDRAFT_115527 [Daphnia pulex]|uniref:Uncharacterized protein n=1 Tax=Daphnia pulex TaxID=6669 RepID=E9HLP6_DAPPU|nr:hypothetical protein DAPPUDRAFT_115527 [Daphnia pulex]|eukprot:EFX67321.1 hypothetical protein DAPPUDRAFT_115527 [Daphnia pulex]